MTAGWPNDWFERKAGAECLMCQSLGGDDDDHGLVVAVLPWTEVRLERRSRLPGYCVVAWKGRHVAEATELDDDECAGYWADVVRVARVLEREFHPMKINLLTLGNWVPHLHTHVVPRYADDPAPGGPITWSDMFSPEPTPAAVLEERRRVLRQALQ